ncbi:SNF2-related protein [Mucilaginibacter arboris]|uniref:DEAD/DEAH box helicase n=1 Tax=Mucilaginibacter arboris TaxID=2682090 RepID=A0A7K1SU39_9SPHI|nr:SNF2-related protein [Mucilaginibacter arboris]MVN20804.1 DEAD/DEAH box helicase [Mucilaginibacter arboris]
MNLTAYHAKFLAYDLTIRKPANDINKFTASLQDAQVDLNPHQVDAALFAFKSPLSNGAILADEVGLGKTIEAGIILSQNWAEKKQRLLIIAPSNLRKQWNQELMDKFFLPSVILEAKSFNQMIKDGVANPFNQENKIVICSYHFARNKEFYLKKVTWDLVIIDEAHRLRNVYKASNKIGNAIKNALSERKKVLLTATPLQNSILELYGLVSIIDDYVFGDLKSFKSQFSRLADKENFDTLRERLQPVCQRTLRRQVKEYINYTNRYAIVEEFFPSENEQKLYDLVSDYLQRDVLFALPVGQRQLITLILRKLLASSSYAISGTLSALANRLEDKISEHIFEERVESDYELFDEIKDEWTAEADEDNFPDNTAVELSDEAVAQIKDEINDLKSFRDLADNIPFNTKAEKLFTALNKGFEKLSELGANKKALIFTESKRTQEYLFNLLSEPGKGYEGEVILFNGTNNDKNSNNIYRNWLEKHKGTDRITGSPTADKRAALVDYFRDEATIMIATEAAAEGINLQFCSLVVNYDLPWNPQRIEQRIGRCHRYGQLYDVVVVNFLNKANAADKRVYELLDKKFKLFDGVFGASDEVLGSIGSGIDFEKRIAKIYNDCRDPASIEQAFDELQDELKDDITERIEDTKKRLLENIDEEVREKLRIDYEKTKGYLNIFERNLWEVTKYYLNGHASFSNENYAFTLNKNPFPAENIHPGPYMVLKPKEGQKKSEVYVPDDTNIYRVGHPLAQRLLIACKNSITVAKELVFEYPKNQTVSTPLENFIGKQGWMQLSLITISAFDEEDYIVIANTTDDGEVIESGLSARFFSLTATEGEECNLPYHTKNHFKEIFINEQENLVEKNTKRNREFFDVEIEKLDQWADDMKIGLQKEIEDFDAEIKLRKAEAKKMLNLEEKVKAQRQIKDLEKKRGDKRRILYEAQDEIDEKKETLLSDVEKRLQQKVGTKELFTIKWKLI